MEQLNEKRLECDKLRSELQEYKVRVESNNIVLTLSSGEEKTKIRYLSTFESDFNFVEFTWNEIFILFGRIIHKDGYITQSEIKREMENGSSRKVNTIIIEIFEQDIIRIQVQLEKLNLIKRISKNNAICYEFTDYGKEEFYSQLLEKKE